jgi:hypothetical protein
MFYCRADQRVQISPSTGVPNRPSHQLFSVGQKTATAAGAGQVPAKEQVDAFLLGQTMDPMDPMDPINPMIWWPFWPLIGQEVKRKLTNSTR